MLMNLLCGTAASNDNNSHRAAQRSAAAAAIAAAAATIVDLAWVLNTIFFPFQYLYSTKCKRPSLSLCVFIVVHTFASEFCVLIVWALAPAADDVWVCKTVCMNFSVVLPHFRISHLTGIVIKHQSVCFFLELAPNSHVFFTFDRILQFETLSIRPFCEALHSHPKWNEIESGTKCAHEEKQQIGEDLRKNTYFVLKRRKKNTHNFAYASHAAICNLYWWQLFLVYKQ